MMENNKLHDMPSFVMVDTNEKLTTCCEKAQQKAVVTLDTEFVRTRTFYPQLGLIQLYDGEQLSLIDPLAITDFSPFCALLANRNVIKVLHACSEDLEVFKHQFNQLPEPMLDTQVMAQFLGAGVSVGLATLLKEYFDFDMDKGASRTDWLARPLSNVQLTYAAGDVAYLLPLFEAINTRLKASPWFDAAWDDCQSLLLKSQKTISSEKMYLKIPQIQKLAGIELCRIQHLAAWRYEEAQKRDLALNFVVKAENLWKVAKNGAKSTFDLLEIGLHPHEVRIHGKKILRILEKCEKEPQENYPILEKNLYEIEGYKQLSKELRDFLNKNFSENVPVELIANKKRVDNFLKWYYLLEKDETKLPTLLQGWRKPFGEQLLKYLESK